LALDEGEWSTSNPGRFSPRKEPGTHWIEDRVGFRTDLHVSEKINIAFSCRDPNPGPSRFLVI
jgi:hypothetical protein